VRGQNRGGHGGGMVRPSRGGQARFGGHRVGSRRGLAARVSRGRSQAGTRGRCNPCFRERRDLDREATKGEGPLMMITYLQVSGRQGLRSSSADIWIWSPFS
jgi:hypothetical protein